MKIPKNWINKMNKYIIDGEKDEGEGLSCMLVKLPRIILWKR